MIAPGRRAAFHGRPADGLAALERVVRSATSDDEVAEASWLLGVCETALGRYARSWSVLDAAPPGRWRSLCLSTAASGHRQIARYAAARALDGEALHAEATDEAEVDARLGLAADAVGSGAADDAQREWERAAALLSDAPTAWRQRVRSAWVRAEIDLLTDRPDDAARALAPAVELATAADAPRHLAKTTLFLGVARNDPQLVRGAAEQADDLGLRPLVWPARALLARWDPADAGSTRAAADAVVAIARELPAGIRQEWLARQEIRELVGDPDG